MSKTNYNVHSKILGAVGKNNTIFQVFTSGAEIAKGIAGRLLRRMIPIAFEDDYELLKERNNLIKKEIEIKQRRVNIDEERFKLEKDKFKHLVSTALEQAARDSKLINLKEEENNLLKEEIECKRSFYTAMLQKFSQYQQTLIQLKAAEIQANWDLHHLPLLISREEIQRGFQRGIGLLILLAPPKVPEGVQGFSNYLEKEVEEALRDVIQFYYSPEKTIYPVDFCKIFKRHIEDVEATNIQKLFVRPTLILSSTVTDHRVYFTVTYPINGDEDNSSVFGNQYRLPSWNWEELASEIQTQGHNKVASIRAVREVIVIMHVVVAIYFSDLYYLSFDPFHDPKLILFTKELPQSMQVWLEPYCASLSQIQLTRKVEVLQEYASEKFRRRDYFHSAQVYRELVQLQPTNSSFHLRLGDSLFFFLTSQDKEQLAQNSYYYEAIRSYWTVLKSNPLQINETNYLPAYRYAEIAYKLAQISSPDMKVKLQKRARDFYNKVIELSQGDESIKKFVRKKSIFIKKGNILLEEGDFVAAFESFSQATKIKPDDPQAWLYRGLTALELEDLRGTIFCLYKVARIEKEFWKNKLFMIELDGLINKLRYQVEKKLKSLMHSISRYKY